MSPLNTDALLVSDYFAKVATWSGIRAPVFAPYTAYSDGLSTFATARAMASLTQALKFACAARPLRSKDEHTESAAVLMRP